MKSLRIGGSRLTTAAMVIVVSMVMAACGNDGSDSEATGSGETTEDSTATEAESPAEEAEEEEAQAEPRTVSLGMSTASVAVPGPWVADILGYYDEENITVEITTTAGAVEASQQAVTGQFDTFYASAPAVLQAMDTTGTDFYPYFNFFYKEFRDWIVPAESDIQSIADVRGTTVGVSDLGGGEIPYVYFLLQQEGIDPETDVDIVAVGNEPANIVQAFESGRIDSMVRTRVITVALQAQGVEIRSIFPDEFAETSVGGLWATESFSEERDVLVRVARATAKGFLFCLTNIDACVDVIGQEYPDRIEDPEVAKNTIEEFAPLFAPPMRDGRYYFGPITTEDAILTIDILTSVPDSGFEDPEGLKERIPPLVLADNEDFLNEVNDFDYDAVVSQAEGYQP